MTNLAYALDCLAELGPCSAPPFADAWKRATWSAEETDALETWAKLRRRFSGSVVDQERQVSTALPIPYRPRDIGTAIRTAAFGARDIDDAASRLSLVLEAEEVHRAREIFTRFLPRAEDVWRANRALLVSSQDGYVALGERADVQALLGQIAAFFAIGDRGAQQTFDLIARPPGAGPTSAEQLGELAVVEVLAQENAARRYPVVAHEMFHAWFSASPIASQVALVERFAASGDPLAGPAWGLLDEVLATALGNGLVARLVDPDDYARRLPADLGLYNDPFIDKIAKALLPTLEKRIAAKGTVFDAAFVPEYLAAVHAAFPDGLPPSAYLRPLFVPSGASGAGAATLLERSPASHIEAYGSLEESAPSVPGHLAWGTAIFVNHRDLDRMGALVPASELAAIRRERARAFVYAFRRRPIGTAFVFVADEDAEAKRLVDAFLALGAPLRDGVIVR